jgi:uncharacterized membrane protein
MDWGYLLDVIVLAIVLTVTFLLLREGFWGSALALVSTLLAGIIAFSTFEALGVWFEQNVWRAAYMPRFLSLLGIFSVTLGLLRLATDKLAPIRVKFPGFVEDLGRIGCSALTGFLAGGIWLSMLQTAPIDKRFLGYHPDKHALFIVGIDRWWLLTVRVGTSCLYGWHSEPLFPTPEDFIRKYHDFRPYGERIPDVAPYEPPRTSR